MNAITFITKEHHKIKHAFKAISKKSRVATKKAKFKKLCRYIILHETMEQKIWYPHFKNAKKVKSEVKHLLSEENHAEKAIKKFKAVKTDDEWEKKFSKFKKAVEHHAWEEEKKLFPNVRQILDKAELEDIGKKLRKFKNKHKTSI